jgi:hypothetical protein
MSTGFEPCCLQRLAFVAPGIRAQDKLGISSCLLIPSMENKDSTIRLVRESRGIYSIRWPESGMATILLQGIQPDTSLLIKFLAA